MAPVHGFFNGNKSVKIEDGAQSGGHSTVNGSITVGRDASIDGSLETVNGTIRVDENSRIGKAKTVNGSVRLAAGVTAGDIGSVNGSLRIAENVTIDGEMSVVNGRISVARGSRVADDVSNVNGEIRIEGAEVGGDLSTVNGDVWLSDNAVLSGDLIIEEKRGWGRSSRNDRKPRVVIGPGTRVEGEIKLEREVELYISETASVGGVSGVMSMEDAVRFSGTEP
jgi:DUF4097 and DUF4098 domain-containing protein YvlB